MGSNRNLLILVIVLVVLGGLYMFTSRQRAYVDPTGGYRDIVEGTLSTDDVFGIDVYRGTNEEDGFQLVKRGDLWVMTNHFDAPANVNKVRTLLGNLESMEGEYRSDDPSVLADYDLDDSTAVHCVVKNEQGEPKVDLLIGKRSGSGCFVRFTGSPEVLLANQNLLNDFGIWGEDLGDPNRSAWLDLVAFKVERDDVRDIDLTWSDGHLDMKKEFQEPPKTEPAATDTTAAETTPPAPPPPTEYEWRVTAPKSFLAVKTKADGILNSLVNLRARDVVARDGDLDSYGLTGKCDQVVVTEADSTAHTLLFGNPLPDDENQFYFKVKGEDLVWSMPKYVRTNIFKKPSDLEPE
jgi:hypothetical protein